MTVSDHHNVAIVSGAAGGLDGVISNRLVYEGTLVCMTDISDAALADATQKIKVVVMQANHDVRNASRFYEFVSAMSTRWSRVGSTYDINGGLYLR